MSTNTVQPGSLNCGTIYNEHNEPLMIFYIQAADEDIIVPPVVLDYTSAQELLGYITDYLIEVEDYLEHES